MITDQRATKKAVMERLKWLTKGAKPGDRLLFHFSGHGSQIRDRNGDELKDKLDEILCPHDMDWDGTYIVDDELRKIFSGLPPGRCVRCSWTPAIPVPAPGSCWDWPNSRRSFPSVPASSRRRWTFSAVWTTISRSSIFLEDLSSSNPMPSA